jgi:hypothetical protein
MDEAKGVSRMTDVDKLKKGLEFCNKDDADGCEMNCQYFDGFKRCMFNLRKDALAFVEEQMAFRRQMFNRCAALTHCDTCELCVYFEECEKERTLNPL